jgi:hypothetical protein
MADKITPVQDPKNPKLLAEKVKLLMAVGLGTSLRDFASVTTEWDNSPCVQPTCTSKPAALRGVEVK